MNVDYLIRSTLSVNDIANVNIFMNTIHIEKCLGIVVEEGNDHNRYSFRAFTK